MVKLITRISLQFKKKKAGKTSSELPSVWGGDERDKREAGRRQM